MYLSVKRKYYFHYLTILSCMITTFFGSTAWGQSIKKVVKVNPNLYQSRKAYTDRIVGSYVADVKKSLTTSKPGEAGLAAWLTKTLPVSKRFVTLSNRSEIPYYNKSRGGYSIFGKQMGNKKMIGALNHAPYFLGEDVGEIVGVHKIFREELPERWSQDMDQTYGSGGAAKIGKIAMEYREAVDNADGSCQYYVNYLTANSKSAFVVVNAEPCMKYLVEAYTFLVQLQYIAYHKSFPEKVELVGLHPYSNIPSLPNPIPAEPYDREKATAKAELDIAKLIGSSPNPTFFKTGKMIDSIKKILTEAGLIPRGIDPNVVARQFLIVAAFSTKILKVTTQSDKIGYGPIVFSDEFLSPQTQESLAVQRYINGNRNSFTLRDLINAANNVFLINQRAVRSYLFPEEQRAGAIDYAAKVKMLLEPQDSQALQELKFFKDISPQTLRLIGATELTELDQFLAAVLKDILESDSITTYANKIAATRTGFTSRALKSASSRAPENDRARREALEADRVKFQSGGSSSSSGSSGSSRDSGAAGARD